MFLSTGITFSIICLDVLVLVDELLVSYRRIELWLVLGLELEAIVVCVR